MKLFLPPLVLLLFMLSCKEDNISNPDKVILIDSVSVDKALVLSDGKIGNVNFNRPEVTIIFNRKIDTTQFKKSKLFFSGGVDTLYSHKFNKNSTSLRIVPDKMFQPLQGYRMVFDVGPNLGGTFPDGFSFNFTTCIDTSFKFPLISEDSLLTLVQKQTFRYFWDYAHPVSGLARERLGSGDIVTIGGSGFGLMAILVGIERKFVTRQQGFDRFRKISNFLISSNTDKFHGAYPHWLNGSTGKVHPFSSKDDGGDLVETAFLIQGLLSVKEYFKSGSSEEKALCDTIQKIYENIDWSWYTRDNQNRLFWHWSPNFDWYMNMPVSGWNEALILYILAAGSPTHSISKDVYDEGWARNGAYPMKNGKSFYGILLPLGEDFGGPLFYSHYSFLALDPRNLTDQYASYWTQNTAHSRINYEYCKSNPKKFIGYDKNCWGLTASDIQYGYSASSPLNDRGVIAPTAALSSFPYTSEESMAALKYFYYILGDKLWGEYGFYDSFNLSSLWFADSYLSIDQGPVICMIENYRTGFLWNLLILNDDVRAGLEKLGFDY